MSTSETVEPVWLCSHSDTRDPIQSFHFDAFVCAVYFRIRATLQTGPRTVAYLTTLLISAINHFVVQAPSHWTANQFEAEVNRPLISGPLIKIGYLYLPVMSLDMAMEWSKQPSSWHHRLLGFPMGPCFSISSTPYYPLFPWSRALEPDFKKQTSSEQIWSASKYSSSIQIQVLEWFTVVLGFCPVLDVDE